MNYESENYAQLCVVCLHLHPTLIESNLSTIVKSFQLSECCLTIFLKGYIDLYAQMRSLTKLTKRLLIAFDQPICLPSDVLQQYVDTIDIDFN
jgi:hypothetical protein